MPNQIITKRELSFRVRRIGRGICFFFFLCALAGLVAESEPKRPAILGIAFVQISSSDPAAAKGFYEEVGALRSNYSALESPDYGVCPSCNMVEHFRRRQEQVILVKYPDSAPSSHIDRIVFRVSDAEKLRHYLSAEGVQIRSTASALGYFEIVDPEGQRIGFLQKSRSDGWNNDMTPVPPRMIHAGFIVRDREKMEHFYKDILGFRPYWHGGMKDDETSWVSLQVPNGTDWLEFMLYDPTGKDKHFLGVMNHIALGVTDIQATKAQLIKNGVKLTEEPKLGRDGKWQLNVYDPDETRVEFMEFTPKEKPCCSEFTAPHPQP